MTLSDSSVKHMICHKRSFSPLILENINSLNCSNIFRIPHVPHDVFMIHMMIKISLLWEEASTTYCDSVFLWLFYQSVLFLVWDILYDSWYDSYDATFFSFCDCQGLEWMKGTLRAKETPEQGYLCRFIVENGGWLEAQKCEMTAFFLHTGP